MYLEKAGTMTKQSYILNSHVYAIPFSRLRPFNVHRRFDNRLSQESYSNLMQSVEMTEATWIQTSKLEAGEPDPSAIAQQLPAGVIKSQEPPTTPAKKTKPKKILKDEDETYESILQKIMDIEHSRKIR